MKRRIVIVVEVFNREILSVILLKRELEKRGYNVSIKRKSEDLSYIDCDILVVPNGYKTSSYYDYRYRFFCKSGKIINLQWEQLHTRYEERNNLWLADGKAKDLVFLCWGNNRVEQLKGIGVGDNKIFKVGPIHTDVMREEFNPIWLKREDIASRYNMDNGKEWLLFISSMTYAPDDSPYINSEKTHSDYMDYNKRHVLEKNTQKKLLLWFEKIISDRKDVIVIYRPHPTEIGSELLDMASKKNKDNFRVIHDYDLKQWIKVSDILAVWNSTSVIECSLTGKKTIILRPFEMEYNEEYVLYDGAKMQKTYVEFENELNNMDSSFPIMTKRLEYYYDIKEIPSYIRIANTIESIYADDGYSLVEKFFGVKRIWYLVRKGIYLKLILKSVYMFIHERTGFRIRSKRIRNKYFVDCWEKTNYERRRVKQIEEAIKKIV